MKTELLSFKVFQIAVDKDNFPGRGGIFFPVNMFSGVPG
jgi:hypothetical protein